MISQNPMASDNDGAKSENFESKSRGIDTGKSLMFSSIAGWSQDYLPKLLIVWNLDKEGPSDFQESRGLVKQTQRSLNHYFFI